MDEAIIAPWAHEGSCTLCAQGLQLPKFEVSRIRPKAHRSICPQSKVYVVCVIFTCLHHTSYIPYLVHITNIHVIHIYIRPFFLTPTTLSTPGVPRWLLILHPTLTGRYTCILEEKAWWISVATGERNTAWQYRNTPGLHGAWPYKKRGSCPTAPGCTTSSIPGTYCMHVLHVWRYTAQCATAVRNLEYPMPA